MAPFIEPRHPPPLRQPRWLPNHHHAKGGLALSGGGYPRPDTWGVLLSHASIRPPVVCSASRAQQQTRVFCCISDYNPNIEKPGKEPPSLKQGKIILDSALRKINRNHSRSSEHYEEGLKKMLQGLSTLEEVAANKDNCSNHQDAKNLLDAVVLPIVDDLHGLDDGARSSIVKASLRAIWKLLQTAPPEVGATLRSEISSNEKVMERIRDTGGWDDEMHKHAREILRTNTQVMNHGELS